MKEKQKEGSYFWGLLEILLTVVFVTLKLTHVIDWSWWWVFAPLWLPVAVVILMILIIVIFACIAGKDYNLDDRD